MSFAQGWQDWMIYHNYFRNRKWGEGFYLDIGTNHATIISNTFDKCLEWKSICAELQSQYDKDIKAKRGCTLLPNCVLGKDTTVVQHGGTTMASFQEASDPFAKGTMKCVGVKSLAEQFKFHKIDLVNLDIEGSEPEVLSCWPFDQVDVTMFLMETNKQDLKMVDFFFHRNGYINAECSRFQPRSSPFH